MKLRVIANDFSVCKIKDIREVCFDDAFVFLSKTDEEISLVCMTDKKPISNILVAEDGWKALKIDCQLEFSMVGILSRISSILADVKISIFAVSTFNTDYIFVKENTFSLAIETLEANGYTINMDT